MLIRRFAFSLVELLVVIAILGVLAAVAMPLYTQYQLRVKVANAIMMMHAKLDELAQTYAKTGTWPSTITFLGGSGAGGWNSVSANTNNITAFTYGASADNLASTIGIQMSTSVVGSSNGVGVIVRYSNGVFKRVCGGIWYGSSIPYTYLPPSCQCTTMGTYWIDGTGGC